MTYGVIVIVGASVALAAGLASLRLPGPIAHAGHLEVLEVAELVVLVGRLEDSPIWTPAVARTLPTYDVPDRPMPITRNGLGGDITVIVRSPDSITPR